MTHDSIGMKDVRKGYRSRAGVAVDALDGIDLRIKHGELLVIIGPTGCGKTTLLNLLAGIEVPDSGNVTMPPGLKPGFNVPCVFQHYTLFPWRSILKNVAFGLEMRGVPRGERLDAAEKMLGEVGLDGFENSFPHELSGGMRQRAALAQALAINPEMLLLDEPFGALDDATRSGLQNMILKLWNSKGITVVFVTHSIDEALLLADRIIVMSGRPGRIVRELQIDMPRPRDGAMDEYLHCFVELRELMKDVAAR